MRAPRRPSLYATGLVLLLAAWLAPWLALWLGQALTGTPAKLLWWAHWAITITGGVLMIRATRRGGQHVR